MKKFNVFGEWLYCRECMSGAYGIVNKVYVCALDKHIYMCDECNLVWETIEDLKENNYSYGEKFAENNGLELSYEYFGDRKDIWYKEEDLDVKIVYNLHDIYDED